MRALTLLELATRAPPRFFPAARLGLATMPTGTDLRIRMAVRPTLVLEDELGYYCHVRAGFAGVLS